MQGRALHRSSQSLLRTQLCKPVEAHTTICLRCTSRIVFSSPNRTTSLSAPRRRHQSGWAAAATAARNVLSNASTAQTILSASAKPLPGGGEDPFRTVANEMKFLNNSLRQLVGSGHPMLDTVAKYYTQSEGKHIRPMLVLLVSQATAECPVSSSPQTRHNQSIDTPISPADVLADVNPSTLSLNSTPSSAEHLDSGIDSNQNLLPSQRRLAEIIELIHTASLLHDDVLDVSHSRRGAPSAPVEFGNKAAVLAGDFLLGRASVALARLHNPAVTELIATVIANLIEGEFMQLRNTAADESRPIYTDGPNGTLDYYLRKTYLKSASLISKSCRAAAILSDRDSKTVDAAYAYGRNLGLAFQLVDDMLDYTTAAASKALGKPAGADLELGLATAPLLFAWRDEQAHTSATASTDSGELALLVGRKFSLPGDVARARELVAESSGVEQTRQLAQQYADAAVDAISWFPDSEAKRGLVEMADKVMTRKK